MMNKQQGSALILSLLILLIMTLLGITSLSTATLEEKMAANDRNQKTIMQHSELALRAAEEAITNADWRTIENNIKNDTVGYYAKSDAQPGYYDNATWQGDSTPCIQQAITGVTSCYIVEQIYDTPPLNVGGYEGVSQTNMGNSILRITARATDTNSPTSAMVQSHLNKSYLQ